jgi:peptidoglycan/LPS O-acetylase OafA/YrhL
MLPLHPHPTGRNSDFMLIARTKSKTLYIRLVTAEDQASGDHATEVAATSGFSETREGRGARREYRYPRRPTRENGFDFLRLVAATVVVVAHASTDLNSYSPLATVFMQVDGVGMFFVMSGMLVYLSAVSTWRHSHGWLNFFYNRWLRVAPAIYVFAIVSPLVLVVGGYVALRALVSRQTVVWLASSFCLLPNYHPSIWSDVGVGTINGQLWTIPAECSFYLVVPIIFLLGRRFGIGRILVALIPVCIIGPFITYEGFGPLGNIVHHTFIENCAYFTAGMLWAVYWERVPKHWALLIAALAVYLAFKWSSPHVEIVRMFQPAFLALPLSYAVVWLALNSSRVLPWITGHIGDLSYGTYIWHVLLIDVFIEQGWVGHWWLVLVLVPLAWLFAAASWWGCERWMLKLKRYSARREMTGTTIAA